ncbi:hypothetical protein BDR04DRAFT_578530 [Suillus decipiens]|nr:hypothetical protein BDR04DRAFT_578530 [Suillus decipiens]
MAPSGLRSPSKILGETDGILSTTWWKDLVLGIAFNTVTVNPVEYLSWLRSELESRGVVFRRQYIRSLNEVKPFVGKAGLLVNATSLGEHMPDIVSYQ